MNKKNIILILVGILIISMRFNVTFGKNYVKVIKAIKKKRKT